jgi:RNA polymerase sigma-70 factor (ECF subfamily)
MEVSSSGAACPDDGEFVANLTSHQGMLQAYLNTLLPGDPDVSDIAQQTSVVVWRKRAEFQPGTSFRAWLLKVAYWEARAWMSTRKRKAWLVFDDELARAVTDRFISGPSARDDRASASLDALRLCLSKLRESDRLVVITHYQHGKSLEECSRILGRSREALKVALFRLRVGLKRCIHSQIAIERIRS